MTQRKRPFPAACVAALAATTLLLGCQKAEPEPAAVRPVRAMRIGDGPALTGRSFPGTTEAVDAVELSFRVGGPIIAFPGDELGKKIAKGDLVAQIDPRDYEVRLRDTKAALSKAKSELEALRKARPEEIEQLKAELLQAEASADFAKAEYQRYLNLQEISKTAVTQSEIQLAAAKLKLADAGVLRAKESLRIGEEGARPEDIQAKQSQIDSLASAVDTAQDELADAKLTAPFDGTISASYVDNFEVVQPRQRVVRLVNSSELEIRVDIPENLIALVPQVDETFVIVQSFPDREIPARIAEVGTEASATTRTYPVKLRFKPPADLDIRPGMSGTVKGRSTSIEAGASNEHVVPTTAVFERDGEQRVWILDPDSQTVTSRAVKTLQTTPYGVAISGVQAGEYVVTAGAHFLTENQKVQSKTADAGGDAS